MANTRTQADIVASMKAYIAAYNTANNKNIDTRQGTVYKDVVIDTPSNEIATTYSDITYAGQMASTLNAAILSSADLDSLGANVNLPRKTATYSVGFANFITSQDSTNPPTSNIAINAGTTIKVPASATNPEVQFRTTQSGFIYIANLNNYAFVDTDGKTRYKITIPIVAITAGSAGNVGSFTITSLTTPVSGINKTINTDPTTGGTDLESNTDYGIRIQAKMAGNNVGTVAGIKSLVLEDSRVLGVNVVLPGDPEMLRDQFGGSVDIYVLGQDIETNIDNIPYVSGNYVNLLSLPAESINSVTGVVSGVSGTNFNLLTECNFIKDITVLKDSTRETSQIRFLTKFPDPNTVVTVSVNYDKLISDLQTEIDSDENHIVTSDILIRRAYETSINIEMTLTIFSGYLPLDVATAVNTALDEAINVYGLGEALNTSDIIALADNTAGVNAVTLTTPTGTIDPGKSGYIRVNQTTIHIGLNTFVF